VAAKSTDEAASIAPDDNAIRHKALTLPDHVQVEYLGTAKPGTKAGVKRKSRSSAQLGKNSI
jgi:hypothetical protein